MRRGDLSRGYLKQLLACVSAIDKYLERESTTDDLTAETINNWIDWALSHTELVKTTINNRRRAFRTLAKAYTNQELTGVYCVRPHNKLPDGYSWQQAKAIVDSVRRCQSQWLEFRYRAIGIKRRDWWYAYLLACWDSGAPTDMRLLRKSELAEDGCIWKLRQKTGKLISPQLSTEALRAIKKISKRKDDLVIPKWCNCVNSKCISQEFRVIRDLAGQPGTLKWFRSGSGTNAEDEHPDQGHIHLGNSRRVFLAAYLVRKHLTRKRPTVKPRPLVA